MSRMVSAIAAVAFISLLSLSLAPAASAYTNTEIPLGYSFYRMHTQVVVILEKLDVSDYPMGNVYTTTPLERVDWVRLWYRYENEGDKADQGYLNVEFIDSLGNVYQAPDGTYTGDNVGPHSSSGPRFLEIPVSKGAKIAKVKVIQGFDSQYFDVPMAGAATATVAATVMPTSQVTTIPQATEKPGGSGNCLPLLPFALLTAIGLAGYAGKKAVKK